MKTNEATTPAMTAEVDGQYLVIRVRMHPPRPSVSGKTLVVASSNGNVPTAAQVNGQLVVVGVNAYIRKA